MNLRKNQGELTARIKIFPSHSLAKIIKKCFCIDAVANENHYAWRWKSQEHTSVKRAYRYPWM